MSGAYDQRLIAEKAIYNNCFEVHDLPPIFHYWSNRYVRPTLRRFGFDDIKDIFKDHLDEQCALHPDQLTTFVSIGSGNCDLEIELVSHLCARGRENFILQCLDLNSTMLERGRAAAQQAGISANIDFVQGDFNEWIPDREYEAVIANQSLHHVLNLEHLFGGIKRSLKPDGSFILSDMIGRNGHQRWPEALTLVQEFWRDLPPSYRFNRSLNRYQELFENWDCSREGFEGIRSQDILPLLIDHFHFRLFLPFGNLIDPFTDRPFGFNFDAEAAWDQEFIDRVQLRDQHEMSAGRITPTHLLAVLAARPVALSTYIEPFTPAFCVRRAGEFRPVLSTNNPYRWGSWPHRAEAELEIACRHLKEGDNKIVELESEVQERTKWARALEAKLNERTEWALRLEGESTERTAWALRLEGELEGVKQLVPDLQHELEDRTEWARLLEAQIENRTNWARKLDREIAEAYAYIASLEKELTERTGWAHDLEQQLLDRTTWARTLEAENGEFSARVTRLESELRSYIHNPWRYLIRLTLGIRNRVRRLADPGSPSA